MISKSQLIVFAGPSIEKEFIQRKLPYAKILPPVAQGQIAEIISHEDVQTILLIDGLFYQSLSVLHKEIILALQQGVNIVGCSVWVPSEQPNCTGMEWLVSAESLSIIGTTS